MHGGAGGDEDHEKMHVNRAFLETFPDFLRRIKTAGEIGQNVSRHRPMAGQQKMRGQPENAAKHRGGQLRFPFIDMLVHVLGAFEKLDVALDDLGKRNVAPAPEFRRGRTGDAGDGGGLAVVSDGDFFPLGFGQRPVAAQAIALAGRARSSMAFGGRRLAPLEIRRVMRSVSRPTSVRPSVATEIFWCARSIVTASSAGSSASVSTTERARHCPASLPGPECFSGDEFMPESLLAYRRTRRDAKGTGEMQIWPVQTVMLLAVSPDYYLA